MATFISNSPAETEAIGRQLAERIDVGGVLALKGELGSGKTLFVKGLVAGVGSSADVTLLDLDYTYEVEAATLRSRSKNSPFLGWRLRGAAVATIVGGEVIFKRL